MITPPMWYEYPPKMVCEINPLSWYHQELGGQKRVLVSTKVLMMMPDLRGDHYFGAANRTEPCAPLLELEHDTGDTNNINNN